MTRTVDIVIVGGNAAAVAATIDAVRRGLRVLVVVRRSEPHLTRRFRQAVQRAAALSPRQLTILAGASVACVDGVNTVEAVIVKRLRTHRLIGFNASELLLSKSGRKDGRRV